MSVREGAGPLLDNPPQPKRRDSPDGESFGYAATLRAANEKGGERKVGRVRGEGIARSGTGTAKRGDSPGGESLDTRRRRSRRQRKRRGGGEIAGIGRRRREAERVRPSGEIRLVANLWIRGAGGAVANEKRWRAAESKNASPQGEAFGGGQERTRRRRSSAEE